MRLKHCIERSSIFGKLKLMETSCIGMYSLGEFAHTLEEQGEHEEAEEIRRQRSTTYLARDCVLSLAPQISLEMRYHGIASTKCDRHRMLLEEVKVCMRH